MQIQAVYFQNKGVTEMKWEVLTKQQSSTLSQEQFQGL